MGNQEISKPLLITVIAVVVVAIGLFGWWYLRPQKYPGFQAPVGNPGAPQRLPGSNVQQPGGPSGAPH